jgi:hypothetical protein
MVLNECVHGLWHGVKTRKPTRDKYDTKLSEKKKGREEVERNEMCQRTTRSVVSWMCGRECDAQIRRLVVRVARKLFVLVLFNN